MDDYRDLPGGQKYAAEGLISAVGMPIHVNGPLWGMIAVGSGEGRLPDDTEARMAEFTELVATAVADAQSHAELISSRARIVAAADEARRRIERDLHDGAQQRLVALALRLLYRVLGDEQPPGDAGVGLPCAISPERSRRPAMPSRNRTSSFANTTRKPLMIPLKVKDYDYRTSATDTS